MSEGASIINLESILAFSTKLNDALDIQFILSSAMLSLMGKLKIPKICAFTKENDKFRQFLCKGSVEQFDDLYYNNIEDLYKIPLDNSEYYQLFNSGFRYILSLKHGNEIIAILAFSDNFHKSPFSLEEIEYLKIVGVVTSSSLANANNYQNILKEKNLTDKKNLLLTTLMEISQDFSNFSSINQILKMFSYHLMGQLLVNKFAIFIKENNNFNEVINKFECSFPDNFIHNLFKIKKITKSEELHFDLSKDVESCNISVISPMIYRNELKGYVLIGKRLYNTDFTPENLIFIEVLANTLTGALENYRLFQEEIEKKKIENELNLALEIQKNLLPKENPKIDGYDIYGTSKPSRAVGGDYFDFVPVNENEHLIIIADVSGKGIPASLLMANLQAAIRTIAPLNLPLNTLLKNLNSLLYRNTSTDRFVTLFISKINNLENTFEYINAGHNPPILINSKNELKELTQGGIVLGIINDVPDFESETLILKSGDRILLYTDGLSEALNTSKEEFGTDRIFRFFQKTLNLKSQEITENLLSVLHNFVGHAVQYDDITLITIQKE